MCSVQGCERRVLARGWCRSHYYRWYRSGDIRADDPIWQRKSMENRLWSRVDKSGGPDACWPWTGPCTDGGYGRLKQRDGKMTSAHRVAWELVHGPIPPGMLVCHHCDNPPCCNPYKCLFLGTQADNIADKVSKNRQAVGDRVGSARLTREQVIVIRERYIPRKVSYTVLAKEYGVNPETIARAIRGESWNVTPLGMLDPDVWALDPAEA